MAWSASLTWSNPEIKSLEKQALVPMFGDHPVELGLREGDGFLPVLRSDPCGTARCLNAPFPVNLTVSPSSNVTKALASFERSIVSGRSPYDRYHYDRDDDAVSDAAKRGEVLFFNQHLSCFRCHGGFNFTDSTVFRGTQPRPRPIEFHNTWAVQSLPGAERRNLRIHESACGRRKVQSPHTAEHRAYRAIHARRQHSHSRKACSTTMPRADREWSQPEQGSADRRLHPVFTRSRRPDRIPEIPHRRRSHSRSAIRQPMAQMSAFPNLWTRPLACALLLLSALLVATGSPGQTPKREVTVAAAANLNEVFQTIGPQFEAATGIHPVFSFASTAQLALQIENSAPYDVYAAADVEHVDQLEKKGLLLPRSSSVYATGILALWIPPGSAAKIDSPGGLVQPAVKVIALAKPELAPYGLAAR